MAGRFDLDNATIGEILDDPEARAIVDETIPGASSNPMVSMVRGMKASSVIDMAGGQADPAVVARLRERLAQL